MSEVVFDQVRGRYDPEPAERPVAPPAPAAPARDPRAEQELRFARERWERLAARTRAT